MSWEIYLGPYFECVRKPVEVVREQSASCGAALIVRTSTTTTYESLFERVNEQPMAMWEKGPLVFMVPNVRRAGEKEHVSFGGTVRQVVDVGTLDIAAERNWLDVAFAAERAILVAECVSVETKWGFHRWWS